MVHPFATGATIISLAQAARPSINAVTHVYRAFGICALALGVMIPFFLAGPPPRNKNKTNVKTTIGDWRLTCSTSGPCYRSTWCRAWLGSDSRMLRLVLSGWGVGGAVGVIAVLPMLNNPSAQKGHAVIAALMAIGALLSIKMARHEANFSKL